MRTPQTHLSGQPSGRPLRRQVAKAVAVVALLLTLTGCAGLPSVVHTAQDTPLDPCTSALLGARADQQLASGRLGKASQALAALQAGRQWLAVATDCPSRWSQGIIQAAAAYHLAKDLSASGLAEQQSDWQDLNQLVTAAAPTAELPADRLSHLDTTSLRALALAQDRAAFGFELLAARAAHDQTDAPQNRALSLAHRATATNLAQAAMSCPTDRPTGTTSGDCPSSDPRHKLYSVQALLGDQTTAVDPATGLAAPKAAIIEMNSALEELAALTGPSAQTGAGADSAAASPVSSLKAADATALADFLTAQVLSAYQLGYPTSPLPLHS